MQVGAIEINRMGSLKYYLWFGISEVEHVKSTDSRPVRFESIMLIVGNENIRLDVHGWTHEAIGTSAPIYKRLFPSASDAYYQVTLKQLRLLAEADAPTFRTADSASPEFIPWYKQIKANSDLAEFLRTVSE